MSEKGQAFVEVIVCIPLILFLVSILFFGVMKLNYQILITDWSEEFLLCSVSGSSDFCEEVYRNRLQSLKGYIVAFKYRKSSQVHLQMKSSIHSLLDIYTQYELSKKIPR